MLRKKTSQIIFFLGIVHMQWFMIFTDLVDFNFDVDRMPLLLCRSPFLFSEVKATDILNNGQYINKQTIVQFQFRPLLKKSFHKFHTDL